MSTKKDHESGRARDCDACTDIAFRRSVEMAWSHDTGADERWSPNNPALGQCAVTALVVQDRYGGDLLRVVNQGISHYFNRLPNGVEIDLTRGQFEQWEPSEPEMRTREYVLSYPATAARYRALRERMGA